MWNRLLPKFEILSSLWPMCPLLELGGYAPAPPTLLRKIVGYGFTNTSMWKISCPTISKPFKFTWTVVSINSLKKESLKVLGFMYSISNEFLFSFFHGIWANKVNFPGQLLSSTCPATVQLSELSRNWNNYSHGRLSSGF